MISGSTSPRTALPSATSNPSRSARHRCRGAAKSKSRTLNCRRLSGSGGNALPSGPFYRRAARVRNTGCRCRPAMSGRVPGRRGVRPGQIGRSRCGHGGWPPASPGQGRQPRRRAVRTRPRPRPVPAGRPGLTPGTMRMLIRSGRRSSRGPRSPGPLRTERCLIRTPTRRGGRPRCSRRMRPGATPCSLDARARRQAPASGPPDLPVHCS